MTTQRSSLLLGKPKAKGVLQFRPLRKVDVLEEKERNGAGLVPTVSLQLSSNLAQF
jgi:hypothetical protein